MNTMQVVLAAANPRGTTQLQLDEEVRRIEVQLAQAAYTAAQADPQRQAALLRIRAIWASQLIDLVRNVTAFTPAVVHFSGHGEGPRGLVMAGEASRPFLVPSSILREERARPSLRRIQSFRTARKCPKIKGFGAERW